MLSLFSCCRCMTHEKGFHPPNRTSPSSNNDMFRVTATRRISPFALFLIESKQRVQLKGLGGVERAAITEKMYKSLSRVKFARLQIRAAAIARGPNRVKRSNRYSTFVGKQYNSLNGTAAQRLSSVAKLWWKSKESKPAARDPRAQDTRFLRRVRYVPACCVCCCGVYVSECVCFS